MLVQERREERGLCGIDPCPQAVYGPNNYYTVGQRKRRFLIGLTLTLEWIRVVHMVNGPRLVVRSSYSFVFHHPMNPTRLAGVTILSFPYLLVVELS